MSITRISEFRARADKAGELGEFLASLVPTISSLDGCRSCRLLRSDDDPMKFVMVEEWESIEQHKASVKNIPPEQFASVMTMLEGMPKGEYFHA